MRVSWKAFSVSNCLVACVACPMVIRRRWSWLMFLLSGKLSAQLARNSRGSWQVDLFMRRGKQKIISSSTSVVGLIAGVCGTLCSQLKCASRWLTKPRYQHSACLCAGSLSAWAAICSRSCSLGHHL